MLDVPTNRKEKVCSSHAALVDMQETFAGKIEVQLTELTLTGRNAYLGLDDIVATCCICTDQLKKSTVRVQMWPLRGIR